MDELIKRSDVLTLAESGVLVSNGNYKSVVDAINGIPAVDRWIPVSERLPDNEDMVLVTCKPKKGKANVNRAYYSRDTQSWHGSGSMSNVTAWMPMPETYDEEDDR